MQVKETLHSGEYIDILVMDNGDLRLFLTPEGKEFLGENSMIGVGLDGKDELIFNRDHTSILADLFESSMCNGGPELVDADEIGALTSAPIVAEEVQRDDNGNITRLERVWWFERYQVESELESLLVNGFVDFNKAEANTI